MSTRQSSRLSGPALTAVAAVLAIAGAGLLAVSASADPSHHAAASRTVVAQPRDISLRPAVTTPSPSAARPARPPRSGHAAASRPPAVRTRAPATGGALPPPGAGPEADPLVQDAMNRAAAGNLAPATARHLVALAKAVWTADVTGAGRDRWPGYFTDPAPSTVYTRFRIQAAAAGRDPEHPKDVVVRLVWAGADPAGMFLDGRTAAIRLIKEGPSWTPVR
ncbi:hypothetical protein [Streptomyces sp. NPDC026673]|uniref:hypothetical protein n=1 Tax=Streptomyces sp. NPDC026673 TaxID=3155724 RepID=UPI0033CA4318